MVTMIMITAVATATKFLYCYNFDCFYEGLYPKKDSPFFVKIRSILTINGIAILRHKTCPHMSHLG